MPACLVRNDGRSHEPCASALAKGEEGDTLKREGEVACRSLANALEADEALVHDLCAW